MRMMMMIFAMLLVALWARPALAQTTVYKCTTAHGVVFSDQPCGGASGKRMQVLHLKQPPPPDADAVRRRQAAEDQQAAELKQDERDRSYRACISNMTAATRRGTKDRIESYRQHIRALQNEMGYTNNNLAGATYANGIQQQIASVRASINSQETILAQTETNARSVCAEQRADARKRDAPPQGVQ